MGIEMDIQQSLFDIEKGQSIYKFTIKNNNGNYVSVLNYGAIIQEVVIKDVKGIPIDVVMGFSDLKGYKKAGGFIGATIGRCANRVGGAKFRINKKEYSLYKNDGENSLHGGNEGFSQKVWGYQILSDGVAFSYLSKAGEEGYPGNLLVFVIYRFNDTDQLTIEYRYSCDENTIVNLTNHSYFNLNGLGNEDALMQNLMINADYFTPLNSTGLVNGAIEKVDGTCFNFREEAEIKSKMDDCPQLNFGNGYDHNYVLLSPNAVSLVGKRTGIKMELTTDYPGLQFYSGNYIREVVGKGHTEYYKHSGVCFEPQFFPNSINVPHFISPIAKANKLYSKNITYHFTVQN